MSKRSNNEHRKINKQNVLAVLALIAIILVIIFGIKNGNSRIGKNNVGSKKENVQEEVKVPEDSTATIVAIGDTLCHSQVFKDAYDSTTKTYDFSPLFKDVTKYFENKTVAVGNLEATLAGPSHPYTGYPTFNTPEHLAVDLKELGLDIMTTANNHSLDIGYSGLVSSLNYLDEAGLEHTGTARSPEEQDKILFKDLNGIKTAFLAFTYGTNGIPVPKGKEYCVNLIDKDFIKRKIDQAKAEGAEAICVSMHWGIEYQTKENSEQDDLADFLIKNDVNVILGCHPHVLQPLQMREVTMEDGTKKSGVVIFSMGNFFSAQTFPNTRDTLIMNIKIRKNGETGKISIDHAKYAPVYDYDNGVNAKDRYELLDLDGIIQSYEAGEKDANGNLKWSKNMYDLAKTEKDRIYKIVGPEIINVAE
jgi:poly-gamma-glutamate synthesis protein (capsule biosynthesis protein)